MLIGDLRILRRCTRIGDETTDVMNRVYNREKNFRVHRIESTVLSHASLI